MACLDLHWWCFYGSGPVGRHVHLWHPQMYIGVESPKRNFPLRSLVLLLLCVNASQVVEENRAQRQVWFCASKWLTFYFSSDEGKAQNEGIHSPCWRSAREDSINNWTPKHKQQMNPKPPMISSLNREYSHFQHRHHHSLKGRCSECILNQFLKYLCFLTQRNGWEQRPWLGIFFLGSKLSPISVFSKESAGSGFLDQISLLCSYPTGKKIALLSTQCSSNCSF